VGRPALKEAGLNIVCRVDDYEELLAAKLARVQGLFAEAGVAVPEVEVHYEGAALSFFLAPFSFIRRFPVATENGRAE
jgi:hypothetical protein